MEQTKSSAPCPLAVMDAAALWCMGKSAHGSDLKLTEARAAVAELVKAARNSAESMGWDESHPVGAALAKFHGGAA